MNFRRYYFPGQIVFITQIVKDRQMVFVDQDMINLFRVTLRYVQDSLPFMMVAYVFLPDHFHLLVQPQNNVNFSQIMHLLKFKFTMAYKKKINFEDKMYFWQKRFWDHIIRDEHDLENHIHYIHNNPVKHGYVSQADEWEHSSYFEWEKRGAYECCNWKEPNDGAWGE